MLKALAICTALLAAFAFAGCGADDGSASDQQQRAVALLAEWEGTLQPVFEDLRDRKEADVRRALPAIERWGRDARKEFVGDQPGDVSRRVIAAGDAWTEWAYTLRTDPPRGDFNQARHIADLAANAIRATGDAYESAGVDLPDDLR